MRVSFEEYYRCVTGQTPFVWQSRMAREIESGAWPAYVALPTGAGKTTLVEIWTYALARDLVLGAKPRRTPLRLVWVIDRRIVVDAVAERAHRLAEKLRKAEQHPDNPLFEIASALHMSGGTAPLTVAQLRGGMAGQRQRVNAPNQPVIVATTVDQAGSRLLFRGYGISPRQYSLEAGLFACDTLIIVDEAHLSQPFVETLSSVQRLHSTAYNKVAPALRVAVVSATLPPGVESERFVLTADERSELAMRLARPKPAVLRADDKTPFARQMAVSAHELLEMTGKGVTAVIVNRVDTARETFSLLQATYGDNAILLTGRIRPYDRDILLDAWRPRLEASRSRTEETPPRVVVATQTVEVGADFDFNALATEVAPLSALRQRLGRLNRLGTHTQAPGRIVQRGKEDGVYPYDLLKQVWEWLISHAASGEKPGQELSINLSDDAITRLLAQGDAPEEMPATNAPILTRAYLEQWSQTSPVPDPDPDVTPFLHGKEKHTQPDVQLVWRADLLERDLICLENSAEARAKAEGRLSIQLDLAPPGIEEAIALPVWAVRRWLAGYRAVTPIGDVEGAVSPDDDRSSPAPIRGVLRWDGRDATVILPMQIAPGDTIVVPATYGGSDPFGWNPNSTEPVRDVGDIASRKRRHRQHLRLHPRVLPSLLKSGEDPQRWIADLRSLLDELDVERHPDSRAAPDAFNEKLVEYITELAPCAVDAVSEALASWQESRGQWIPYPIDKPDGCPTGVVLEWVIGANASDLDVDPIVDAADQGSMVGVGRRGTARTVTLSEHSEAVAACAGAWASACGLPERIVQTLAWAGRLHDIGKCEPRFQLMLHGGDEIAAAVAPEPLAKSGMDPHDRVRQEQARRLARLPIHMRHEAISARLLLDASAQLPAALDRELLCHLVGTHHGHGRPWFPIVGDPAPTSVSVTAAGYTLVGRSATGLERIDSGWPDLFAALQRRYGVWGLAYLEAVLRLADHWISSREAQL